MPWVGWQTRQSRRTEKSSAETAPHRRGALSYFGHSLCRRCLWPCRLIPDVDVAWSDVRSVFTPETLAPPWAPAASFVVQVRRCSTARRPSLMRTSSVSCFPRRLREEQIALRPMFQRWLTQLKRERPPSETALSLLAVFLGMHAACLFQRKAAAVSSRGRLASPPSRAETRTSCPCRSPRKAAATAASKAASFVSFMFSAFPSWRTRHSALLPMIFRSDHVGERFNGRALDSWFCLVRFGHAQERQHRPRLGYH
jgi:hypothetical protein